MNKGIKWPVSENSMPVWSEILKNDRWYTKILKAVANIFISIFNICFGLACLFIIGGLMFFIFKLITW